MIHGISKGSQCIVTDINEITRKESKAAIEKATAWGYVIGSKVSRIERGGGVDKGTIIGYNGKQSDLYGGDCYPIIVEWDKFDPKESTGIFEYHLGDVILMEVPDHLTPFCIHQIPASSNLAVQDDITGDRDRAFAMPFELRKQYNNDGPLPVEVGPRWYGYVWAESREEAVVLAQGLMNV